MLLHSLLQTYCEFLNFVYVVFDALQIENYTPPNSESPQFHPPVCITHSDPLFIDRNEFGKREKCIAHRFHNKRISCRQIEHVFQKKLGL